MVMEYGENDDAPDGVTKWPFYLSALFYTRVGSWIRLPSPAGKQYARSVADHHLRARLRPRIHSRLHPSFVDRFLTLFSTRQRKDEELHRKTYFDIKEMRGDLESLAVKIDKVPSVVDKILSESLAKGEDANSSIDKLANDLEETKDELIEKLGQLRN